MLLADGFEEIEAIAPLDILRRANIETSTVSLTRDPFVNGGHDIAVIADLSIDEVDFESIDMLVLPGGGLGVDTISKSTAAMDLIARTWKADKLLAAICAAPSLLAKLDILDGMSVICHPSVADVVSVAGGKLHPDAPVVCDGNLITGVAAGASIDFGLKLVEVLRGGEASENLRKSLHYV